MFLILNSFLVYIMSSEKWILDNKDLYNKRKFNLKEMKRLVRIVEMLSYILKRRIRHACNAAILQHWKPRAWILFLPCYGKENKFIFMKWEGGKSKRVSLLKTLCPAVFCLRPRLWLCVLQKYETNLSSKNKANTLHFTYDQ